MKSFLPRYIDNLSIPIEVSIINNLCSEAKGKEELWEKAKAEVLEALKEQSIISSTESSNRIEGIEVEKDRLRPLVKGKVKPQDRSEEEVLGYKNALDWIHSDASKIEITPELIQKLHHLSLSGSIGDAGKWKVNNNNIIEIHSDGSSSIRFKPVEPKDVPKAISNLCNAYSDAVKNTKLPDLLIIASTVFDFLCIHPFRDGNGRTSRLLTLLLLYQHHFDVGRYISIEKIIEDTKESYYQALKESSKNWHSAEHSLTPFWLYFVRTIKVAYEQLESKVQVEGLLHGGKTTLVRKAILNQVGEFKLGDIVNLEKGISEILIKKTLSQMKDEGIIELRGFGRGSYWKKVKR